MALRPEDLVSYQLKKAVRGYSTEQVDELLDQIADQIERSDRELDELRERVRDTEARLAEALENESAIRRTVAATEGVAERALQEAREQADELREACEAEVRAQLEAAEAEAARIVDEAREQADRRLADAERSADGVEDRAMRIIEAAEAEAQSELRAAREQRGAIEIRLDALRALADRNRAVYEQHLLAQLDQLRLLDGAPGVALDYVPPVEPPPVLGVDAPVPDDADASVPDDADGDLDDEDLPADEPDRSALPDAVGPLGSPPEPSWYHQGDDR